MNAFEIKRENENNPANNLPIIIFENKTDKPPQEWQVSREENKSFVNLSNSESESQISKIAKISVNRESCITSGYY